MHHTFISVSLPCHLFVTGPQHPSNPTHTHTQIQTLKHTSMANWPVSLLIPVQVTTSNDSTTVCSWPSPWIKAALKLVCVCVCVCYLCVLNAAQSFHRFIFVISRRSEAFIMSSGTDGGMPLRLMRTWFREIVPSAEQLALIHLTTGNWSFLAHGQIFTLCLCLLKYLISSRQSFVSQLAWKRFD